MHVRICVCARCIEACEHRVKYEYDVKRKAEHHIVSRKIEQGMLHGNITKQNSSDEPNVYPSLLSRTHSHSSTVF